MLKHDKAWQGCKLLQGAARIAKVRINQDDPLKNSLPRLRSSLRVCAHMNHTNPESGISGTARLLSLWTIQRLKLYGQAKADAQVEA